MRMNCKTHGDTPAFRFPWENDDIYRCVACRDETAINAAGVPKRFMQATCTPENAAWLSSARDSWAAAVFFGPTGTGKTYQTCGMVRQAILGSMTALYIHAEKMSKEIMANGADRFIKHDLLVIDEITRGFDTVKERDRILAVIDGRYGEMLPVVIAGNFKKDALPDIVGLAAYDRIMENATFRFMGGQSLRIK